MSQENFKALIKELGQNLSLSDLAADDDNYCCLGFDEKIVIHLQYNEENDILMLFSQLGAIDESKMAQLAPRLLKANLFWQGTGGGTIGLDDESGEVLMSYQLALGSMDFPKFQDVLEGFVNTSEIWINTLEAVQSGQLDPKDADKAASEAAEE